MLNKQKFIKNAFKRYKEHKTRLRKMSFDGLRAVDYSRTRTSKSKTKGQESAIVHYLDEKAAIEKQIEIVDRVLWFYELDDSPKHGYIVARWVKGFPAYRAAMECYISESTGHLWAKEIWQVGERAADMFNLWVSEE